MGVKVRERPEGSGDWWIFIDHMGKRKAKKIGRDKRLAREVAKKIEARLVLDGLGFLDGDEDKILFKKYYHQWLEGYVRNALKASTWRNYQSIGRIHLLPAFGNTALADLTRNDIKQFLFAKLKTKLSPARVRRIKGALSGMLSQAVEDEFIQVNPALKLDKYLNSKDQSLGKEKSPYTAEELEIYLDTIRRRHPNYYPLFLTLARTGMRLGEALALQWGDVSYRGKTIEIRRALVEGRLTTTKTGRTRIVSMTPQLSSVLQSLKTRRKEMTLKMGWKKMPDWAFINQEGNPLDGGNLRARVHYKSCEMAGLKRIRIHDLRHSYATIRITAGHNIADVSKQLGHASIKITVDTYYHAIPSQASGEVEELDELGKPRNHPQPIRNQKETAVD